MRRLVRDLTIYVLAVTPLLIARHNTLAAPPSASHWALVNYTTSSALPTHPPARHARTIDGNP